MSSAPANYPSPTQQHASPYSGPFFASTSNSSPSGANNNSHNTEAPQQPTHQPQPTSVAAAAAAANNAQAANAEHNASSGQEMADDARLRSELTRQIGQVAVMAEAQAHYSQQQRGGQQQDHQQQTQRQQQQDQGIEMQQGREQQHIEGQHEGAEQGVRAYNGGMVGPHHEEMGAEGQQGSPMMGMGMGQQEMMAQKDRRSKVSRACDECRRKKIRCDAPDESGATPCSNCRRTGAPCAFSRQPMKRGPSKGYIKELAERLNALEGQIHPHHGQQTNAELHYLQQQFAEATAGAPPRGADMQTPEQTGRKRTYSQSEGFVDTPSRPSPYGNSFAESHRPNLHPSLANSAPPASMQPPPDQRQYPNTHGGLQPFFKYGGDTGRRESVSTPYESEPPGGAGNLIDWDEEVVDEYYRIIHQTFPLLSHSKNNLRRRLADCPVSLREAFLMALECTMRTFPSPTSTLQVNSSYAPMMKRAAELLASYPFDNPSSHTNASNLVYLQTLLLMALESDNHGPATIRGQAGPSRSEWLGRAAGVAGHLEINLVRPRERFVTEGDPDSEERLSRRVWWVLFILDRWHASSTADLLKLPENSVVLLPEDQILLGESTYHLARLSFIIGHLAAILTTTKTPETNVMAPTNPASALLGLTLAGEIDRFRESVESVWGTLNLVHLCYHHSHLLIKRLSPTSSPSSLLPHAVKVATVLNQRQTPITPLNHHFAALSAMTLCELVDVEETKLEAKKGLEEISQAVGLGRGFAGRESSTGWDSAIRELVVAKKGKLAAAAAEAEAAAGSGGGGEEAGGVDGGVGGGGEGNVAATSAMTVGTDGRKGAFDPTMLTRYGYLTALGQGMFDVL